ncbi:MAG: nodulation protein NfeD [Geobacter sp.]|nr:nodulation protein NfeD [Geobacter sp.]
MKWFVIAMCWMVFFLLPAARAFAAEGKPIHVLAISDPVTPVTADYLHGALKSAAESGAELVLVEIDTPGGLDTAMRQMVKDIMASPVPVVVHVAPSGARAASAGAVITLAADIAAMAPGTNIGAAHPVNLGEKPDNVMEQKVVNDAEAYLRGIAEKRGRNAALAGRMVRESLSLPAEEALKEGVIDLIAADRADILRKLDGRELQRGGNSVVLRTVGARIEFREMSARQRILSVIGNPNVAYVLLMIGILGIFFELSNPGVILPGVFGGISLILAFFAFQTLPVNYAGVLLILLALILFILEVKVVSHGMLTVGGVISMVLGSLMLFESPEPYLRVSWQVIVITVAATVIFFLFAVTKALKAYRKKPATGAEGLVGERGKADTDIAPEGKVFVRGEYWEAWSDEPISAGEKIEVVAVEGMRVKVRKGGSNV